jgi:GrpB-like predicted nucleotidyltransferase (UPF0157 family)
MNQYTSAPTIRRGRLSSLRKRNESSPTSPLQIALEHIGNTSVADLPAKPIIDIMVGVQEKDTEGVRRGLDLWDTTTSVKPAFLGGFTSANEYRTPSTCMWFIRTDRSGKPTSR